MMLVMILIKEMLNIYHIGTGNTQTVKEMLFKDLAIDLVTWARF